MFIRNLNYSKCFLNRYNWNELLPISHMDDKKGIHLLQWSLYQRKLCQVGCEMKCEGVRACVRAWGCRPLCMYTRVYVGEKHSQSFSRSFVMLYISHHFWIFALLAFENSTFSKGPELPVTYIPQTCPHQSVSSTVTSQLSSNLSVRAALSARKSPWQRRLFVHLITE